MLKLLVITAFAGLALAMPTAALADECGDCCAGKACAMKTNGDGGAGSVLLPSQHAAPARQAAVVWFMRPVMIGRHILQGRYVIEHDNDRTARGEPCTHIYAYNNRRVPVVAFHCTHLDRPAPERGTVTVVSTGEPIGLQKVTAFQFAGETGAHGVPTGR